MRALPRDAVLPQLGGALDTAVMQSVFDDALRAHDGRRATPTHLPCPGTGQKAGDSGDGRTHLGG